MINQTRGVLFLAVELAVLFFVVTLLVQLLQRRFGPDRLRAWIGGRPVVAALKGIAIGFATPFCTFTAIPMLIGMRQAGVAPAGYVAFVVAAPVLDPVLFGALLLIAGPQTAAIYASVTFVAALGLALAAQSLGIERFLTPITSLTSPGRGASESCHHEPRWTTWRQELGPAARSATRLLRGLAPILVAGVAVSLLIENTVPPDLTQRLTTANPTLSIPIAAAIGTPLYVSTALFVPIADSLRGAGVDMGAIVALTIAGAGANLPEFVVLSKLARPAAVGSLFAFVFGVAVAGGFLTQSLVG